MVPVRPKPGPITASARDCFPCEHRHGGHQVVPVDRGPGRSVWPTHFMMQHAGRPRVSTSRPVAAAASVTDLVGYPSSDAIVARRLSTGPAAPANDFRRRDALSAEANDPGFAARLRTPPGLFARAKCEDRLCPGQVDRLLARRPWPRPRRSIAVHLGRFLVLPLEIPPSPPNHSRR